ncbi:Uncharacterised protein [Myroides odoratimimus]|uniref:hypothetical protein n=1 Tax=Myroides odoratimimus TaxID=76832 RepID=UPI00073E7A20|nr:hypothetical protein [Myroides odoratimimus]STZ48154.1 Uncharacterised protein [Myroides odoratimimus]
MTKVKRLYVSVTYEVDLEDIEIPDDILEELNEAVDNGDDVTMQNYPESFEWLVSNIKQDDSFRDEYDIQDLLEYGSKTEY